MPWSRYYHACLGGPGIHRPEFELDTQVRRNNWLQIKCLGSFAFSTGIADIVARNELSENSLEKLNGVEASWASLSTVSKAVYTLILGYRLFGAVNSR
jgi:hypothetical protein